MNLNMTVVDDVLVRNEIKDVKFCCDLDKCKGCCCTFESDHGAPLLEDELEIIESTLPFVKKYLSQRSIEVLEEKGFFERIENNDPYTIGINNKDCVFVYYDNDGVAKCAIEKAYLNGEVNYKKPISCHLFPIRIHQFGGDILVYEKFHGCGDALPLGKKLDIPVYKFCKESIVRKYGQDWYDKLEKKWEK